MSDTAIRIIDLEKVYRRYSSNGWRAASLFGIHVPASKYDQFWALDKVSLTVGRGERVALVGRNGAGKSTLLRHISGELTPTAGSVEVNGEVKALFGLGDGFHPEFSGLDNIKTALALHGFRWKDIPAAVDEIIEFTELEDFIHRPLKEYSAGMYARLAFATATAAKPDILIIDEILGAGDAYFLGKCLQRIRDITSGGTTVLFVSHDMSSALMLCQRGIWIHQGKVREDGEMTKVARSYQAHIREEQELSLRARSMRLSKKALTRIGETLLLRLIADGEKAPSRPFFVARLAFGQDDLVFGETQLGNQDSDGEIVPLIDIKTANWGKSTHHNGVLCRPFGDFGGSFVHAPFSIRQSSGLDTGAWIELDISPSSSDAVMVQAYDETLHSYRTIGTVPASTDATWRTLRFALDLEPASVFTDEIDDVATTDATAEPSCINHCSAETSESEEASRTEAETNSAQPTMTAALPESEAPPKKQRNPSSLRSLNGRPTARITNFTFIDAREVPRYTLVSGEPMAAVIDFEAHNLPVEPVAVVAIYRPDGTVISQMISSPAPGGKEALSGLFQIVLRLEELLIGPGDFIVSVALFRELDPSRAPEDCAYDLQDRSYALKILELDHQPYPSGLVRQNPSWELRRPAAPKAV
jgi:lipopolysaccharide transport system ATP-binding protein